MKMYVFEGSAEELSEVASNLGIGNTATITASSVPQVEPDRVAPLTASDKEAVSLIFARRVLKRRDISEPMKAVLTTLYEAGSEMVDMSKLCEVSNYTRPQFAGLMGSFGRRISHTHGYDAETYFFKTEWDAERQEWFYSLPSSVREALVEEGLV